MHEILVIEDSDTDAELLERALRAAGVTNPIRRFADGARALAHFKEQDNRSSNENFENFSILFLDLKLPRASGFDILAYLGMSQTFQQMLKVVFSELDNLESIRTAFSLGAGTFLSKPIHEEDLQDVIKAYPEHWRMDPVAKVSSL
jgi:CheY-like chemotaxis protein